MPPKARRFIEKSRIECKKSSPSAEYTRFAGHTGCAKLFWFRRVGGIPQVSLQHCAELRTAEEPLRGEGRTRGGKFNN